MRTSTPQRVCAICLVAAVAFACTSRSESPKAALVSPRTGKLISDQQHSQGRQGFAWEPPMVPAYEATPGFRGDVSPVVRIDELDPATGNAVNPVVAFTLSGICKDNDSERAPRCHAGGYHRQHDTSFVNGFGDTDPEAYFQAVWDTDEYPGLKPYPVTYRITVLVNGWTLGFADTQLDVTRAQFKNTDTNNYVPLMDGKKLRIKFRIDTPAIDADLDGVLDAVDNCWKVPNGPAQAGIPGVGNQTDTDGDHLGDACDPCPRDAHNDQDHDGYCANELPGAPASVPHFRSSIAQVSGYDASGAIVTTAVSTGITGGDDPCPNLFNLAQDPAACATPPTVLSGGGVVAILDPASPIQGAQALFAQGTLPPGSAISIAQLQPADLPPLPAPATGPIVDFAGPAGLVYDPPVQLSLPYDRTRVEDPSKLLVYHFRADLRAYETLPVDLVDPVNGLVVFRTTSLSPFYTSVTQSVELTAPAGFFVDARGRQTLDLQVSSVGSGLFSVQGQAGVPSGYGATNVVITFQNLSKGPQVAGSGPVTTTCDSKVLSSPAVTSCLAFSALVPIVNLGATQQQQIVFTATPQDKNGAPVGSPTTGSFYVNVADFPSPPTTVAASRGGTASVTVTWSGATGSGITGYTIARSTVSGGTYGVAGTTGAGSSSFTDSGLPGGAAFYYVVYATNAAGRSSNSPEAFGTTAASAITSVTAVPGGTSTSNITVAWTAPGCTAPCVPPRPASYLILRGAQAGGPYQLVKRVPAPFPSPLAYADTSASAPGTLYFYVVEWVSAFSVASSPSVELAWATLPATPTGLVVAAQGPGTQLTWDPAPAQNAITSYRIYRAGTPGAEALIGSVDAAQSSFPDLAPPTGTTLYYQIAAVDIAGTSAFSTEVSIPGFPSPVTDLSAVATQATVTLSWTATAGAAHYNVYRRSVSGGAALLLGTTAGTGLTDLTGAPGATYAYLVRPENSRGEAANSNEARATLAPPAVSTLTAVATGPATIQLRWTASTGATAYDVLRSATTGGPYQPLSLAVAGSPYDDTTALSGAWFYVVRALNGAGSSGNSNEATASLARASPPWSSTALSGGAATSVVIDPNNASVLYAGSGSWRASNSGSGVYKSTDGGGTWSQASTGLPQANGYTAVLSLAFAPGGATLYAGLFGSAGVYKTTDGGATWTEAAAGLNGKYVYALAVDSAGTVYAAAGGVYRLAAGATSWTAAVSNPGDTRALVLDSSTAPATVYAGTYGYGVFKSTDGGANFASLTAGMSAVCPRGGEIYGTALGLDPGVSPPALYVGEAFGCGLLTSPDGGATWAKVAGAPSRIPGLQVLRAGPALSIYAAAAAGGVSVSSDGGLTWAASNPQPGNETVALAVDPLNHSTVYAGSSGGRALFKSTDGAVTWSTANAGFSNARVYALATDPHNGALHALALQYGIFVSADLGASWTDETFGIGSAALSAGSSLIVDGSTTPSTLYLAANCGGVWKMPSGGAGWTQLNEGFVSTCINALAADSAGTLFAGTGYGNGIYRRAPADPQWTQVTATASTIYALAVDPKDARSVYAGMQGSGILRSGDGGATWSGAAGADFIWAFAFDPATTPSTVYAGSLIYGVYRSGDAGASWSKIGDGSSGMTSTGIHALATDGLSPPTLYAGGDQGAFYLLKPNTSTWVASPSMPGGVVNALVARPGGTVFAGTEAQGVVKTSTGGL